MLAFVNKELGELQRSEQSYSDVKSKYKMLKMIPFNSETKKMTVAIELDPGKKVRIFTKGASENIIDDCAYMHDAKQSSSNGSQSPKSSPVINLDLNKRDGIKEQILKHMA